MHEPSRRAQQRADAAQLFATEAQRRSEAALVRAHEALAWISEQNEQTCRRRDRRVVHRARTWYTRLGFAKTP